MTTLATRRLFWRMANAFGRQVDWTWLRFYALRKFLLTFQGAGR